jgi:hypothetical protein
VAHYLEAEHMRLSLEDTLYDQGVDVVISGHVHSYERAYNVYRNKVSLRDQLVLANQIASLSLPFVSSLFGRFKPQGSVVRIR